MLPRCYAGSDHWSSSSTLDIRTPAHTDTLGATEAARNGPLAGGFTIHSTKTVCAGVRMSRVLEELQWSEPA